MKNNYEKIILEKLIKKYENSSVSKNITVKRRISLIFDSKNMPNYVSDDSYLYEDAIEQAVSNLENLHFIEAKKNKLYKQIERVYLNIDYINEIYKYMNTFSPQEKNQRYLEIIKKYYNKDSLVKSFCDIITNKLDSFQSTKKYFNNEKELEEILVVLDKLSKQKTEISRRKFSAKYLHDSKRLEAISSKICSIIKECTDYEEEDCLLHYNVYKNPNFVYIKGNATFKINNQVINLQDLQTELVLSSNQILNLEVLSLPCQEIITVENLDSFYNYPSKDRCILYLGGFHNEIRKVLLLKLYNFNKQISFFHSGDIDVGGFYILAHLIESTNINFDTKKMDIETLIKYKNYAIKLTSNDKVRLQKLKENKNMYKYLDVLNYMEKENIKLEQENIDYE